jgi:hypothetical protein
MRRYVCDYIVNALEQLTLSDQSSSSVPSLDKTNSSTSLKSPRLTKGLSNVTGESLASASMSIEKINESREARDYYYYCYCYDNLRVFIIFFFIVVLALVLR